MLEEISKKLISFPTVAGNKEAFQACFSYIQSLVAETDLLVRTYEFEGEMSLLITNQDTLDLDILFCGHIDVVEAKSSLFQPHIKQGRLYGRGAFDMKGHDAVMIACMKQLPPHKKIGLLLTSDEERGGFQGTNRLVNEVGLKTKVAIVPDAGNDFALVTQEKGVLQIELTAHGKSAHASKPYEGNNAIDQLLQVYQALLRQYPLPKDDTMFQTSINLSKITGGDAINKVPETATLILDIRHIPSDTKEQLLSTIQKENPTVEIKILACGDAFEVDPTHPYLKQYQACCEQVLNRPIHQTTCESSSDGRFFTAHHIPCILMNATGHDLHGPNEYVEIESLEKLYQIYQKFIKSSIL